MYVFCVDGWTTKPFYVESPLFSFCFIIDKNFFFDVGRVVILSSNPVR